MDFGGLLRNIVPWFPPGDAQPTPQPAPPADPSQMSAVDIYRQGVGLPPQRAGSGASLLQILASNDLPFAEGIPNNAGSLGPASPNIEHAGLLSLLRSYLPGPGIDPSYFKRKPDETGFGSQLGTSADVDRAMKSDAMEGQYFDHLIENDPRFFQFKEYKQKHPMKD